MNYWLMKSEPNTYSIDDLINQPNKTDHWDGIRNYQVRNFLRDDFRQGDLAFFYHSNCKIPAIVGIVEIVSDAYPDYTAFDINSKYYSKVGNPENPVWFMVDIKFRRKLNHCISLAILKEYTSQLGSDFSLIKKGNRLSIIPLFKKQWDFILSLEDK